MPAPRLRLHEELMLLALRDREGTVFSGTMYPYGLGGAVLAELVLEERISIDEKGRVRVESRTPLGHTLIDEWLREMAEREKPRKAADWVGRIANTKELRHRVAVDLVRKGILRADEESVLFIFTRRIYPEVDPGPERDLMDRVDAAVFGDGSVDARTAVIATLAHHTSILPHLFDRKALKSRKERIEQIAEGDVVVGATADAIESVQAAIMIATIMPAIVTTTIITN